MFGRWLRVHRAPLIWLAVLSAVAPPVVGAQRGTGLPAGPPSDAPWLDLVRKQPDQIAGYLTLSNMYYATRRYDDAERFLMGALTLVRKRLAPAPAPSPPAGFIVSPARAGVDVGSPARIREVPPDYPAAALDARIGGTVGLELTIDERGVVSDARVAQPVPGLDEAALAAVRRWEFVPTVLRGKPLAVSMTARMTFIPDPVVTVPRDVRRQVAPALAMVRRSFEGGAFKDAEIVLESVIAAVQRERDEPRVDVARSITTGRTSTDWPLRAGRELPVPQRTKDNRPQFTPEPGSAGGLVTLEFIISPEGKVGNIRALGLPAPALERLAREAVGQWEFAPTLVGGQAIPIAMGMTLNFSAQRGTVDEVVRVGGDVQEPRKTRDVRPIYPREALSGRQSGTVLLEAVINPAGKVTDLRIARGVSDALDKAAITAVRQWEFTPTLIAGVPVAVVLTVTVSFNVR